MEDKETDEAKIVASASARRLFESVLTGSAQPNETLLLCVLLLDILPELSEQVIHDPGFTHLTDYIKLKYDKVTVELKQIEVTLMDAFGRSRSTQALIHSFSCKLQFQMDNNNSSNALQERLIPVIDALRRKVASLDWNVLKEKLHLFGLEAVLSKLESLNFRERLESINFDELSRRMYESLDFDVFRDKLLAVGINSNIVESLGLPSLYNLPQKLSNADAGRVDDGSLGNSINLFDIDSLKLMVDALKSTGGEALLTDTLLSVLLRTSANSSIHANYDDLFSVRSRLSAKHFRRMVSETFQDVVLKLDGLKSMASSGAPVTPIVVVEERGSLKLSPSIFKDIEKVLDSSFDTLRDSIRGRASALSKMAFDVSNVLGVSMSGFDPSSSLDSDKLLTALNSDKAVEMALSAISVYDRLVEYVNILENSDEAKHAIQLIRSVANEAEASLIAYIESFDPMNAMSLAERALMDEEARKELINNLKKGAVDFLSQYLPTLSIAPFSAVKNDIVYHISDLDLTGFRLDKDQIIVTMPENEVFHGELLFFKASGINARFVDIGWRYSQSYFPHLSGKGVADATVLNATVEMAFRVVRVPKGVLTELFESTCYTVADKIQNLQLKFPGLSSDAETNIWSLSTEELINIEWDFLLVLGAHNVSIEQLELHIDDNSLSWLYNALISAFCESIRERVQSALSASVISSSALLLNSLNRALFGKLHIMTSLMQLKSDVFPICSRADLFSVITDSSTSVSSLQMSFLSSATPDFTRDPSPDHLLQFLSESPVGLTIDLLESTDTSISSQSKLNVHIVGLVGDGQACSGGVLERAGLPLESVLGAVIRTVNGKRLKGMSLENAIKELTGPRPLFIRIRLCEDGFLIYKSRYEKDKKRHQEAVRRKAWVAEARSPNSEIRKLVVKAATFNEGPLGLRLMETQTVYGQAVLIVEFSRSSSGEVLQAERLGSIFPGMILLAINDTIVVGLAFDETTKLLQSSSRPLELFFVESTDHKIFLESQCDLDHLQLVHTDDKILLASDFTSMLEETSKSGSVVLQVNELALDGDASVNDVLELIRGLMPGVWIRVRDWDSYMHVICLRDGAEKLRDCADIQRV